MSIIIRILSITVLSLAVGACQSITFNNPFGDDKAKTRTSRNSSLEVPPDLVETTNLPTENVLAAPAEDPDVLPEPLNTELVRDGDKHWLTIDADAAVVWKKLVRYWDKNDVSLVVSEPHTGTMETEWILTGKDKRPGGQVENLFNNLLALDKVYEKYLVRLERAGDGKTNLYVNFRESTKQVEETVGGGDKKVTEFAWKEVGADPERELDFLRDLAYELDPSNVLGG